MLTVTATQIKELVTQAALQQSLERKARVEQQIKDSAARQHPYATIEKELMEVDTIRYLTAHGFTVVKDGAAYYKVSW